MDDESVGCAVGGGWSSWVGLLGLDASETDAVRSLLSQLPPNPSHAGPTWQDLDGDRVLASLTPAQRVAVRFALALGALTPPNDDASPTALCDALPSSDPLPKVLSLCLSLSQWQLTFGQLDDEIITPSWSPQHQPPQAASHTPPVGLSVSQVAGDCAPLLFATIVFLDSARQGRFRQFANARVPATLPIPLALSDGPSTLLMPALTVTALKTLRRLLADKGLVRLFGKTAPAVHSLVAQLDAFTDRRVRAEVAAALAVAAVDERVRREVTAAHGFRRLLAVALERGGDGEDGAAGSVSMARSSLQALRSFLAVSTPTRHSDRDNERRGGFHGFPAIPAGLRDRAHDVGSDLTGWDQVVDGGLPHPGESAGTHSLSLSSSSDSDTSTGERERERERAAGRAARRMRRSRLRGERARERDGASDSDVDSYSSRGSDSDAESGDGLFFGDLDDREDGSDDDHDHDTGWTWRSAAAALGEFIFGPPDEESPSTSPHQQASAPLAAAGRRPSRQDGDDRDVDRGPLGSSVDSETSTSSSTSSLDAEREREREARMGGEVAGGAVAAGGGVALFFSERDSLSRLATAWHAAVPLDASTVADLEARCAADATVRAAKAAAAKASPVSRFLEPARGTGGDGRRGSLRHSTSPPASPLLRRSTSPTNASPPHPNHSLSPTSSHLFDAMARQGVISSLASADSFALSDTSSLPLRADLLLTLLSLIASGSRRQQAEFEQVEGYAFLSRLVDGREVAEVAQGPAEAAVFADFAFRSLAVALLPSLEAEDGRWTDSGGASDRSRSRSSSASSAAGDGSAAESSTSVRRRASRARAHRPPLRDEPLLRVVLDHVAAPIASWWALATVQRLVDENEGTLVQLVAAGAVEACISCAAAAQDRGQIQLRSAALGFVRLALIRTASSRAVRAVAAAFTEHADIRQLLLPALLDATQALTFFGVLDREGRTSVLQAAADQAEVDPAGAAGLAIAAGTSAGVWSSVSQAAELVDALDRLTDGLARAATTDPRAAYGMATLLATAAEYAGDKPGRGTAAQRLAARVAEVLAGSDVGAVESLLVGLLLCCRTWWSVHCAGPDDEDLTSDPLFIARARRVVPSSLSPLCAWFVSSGVLDRVLNLTSGVDTLPTATVAGHAFRLAVEVAAADDECRRRVIAHLAVEGLAVPVTVTVLPRLLQLCLTSNVAECSGGHSSDAHLARAVLRHRSALLVREAVACLGLSLSGEAAASSLTASLTKASCEIVRLVEDGEDVEDDSRHSVSFISDRARPGASGTWVRLVRESAPGHTSEMSPDWDATTAADESVGGPSSGTPHRRSSLSPSPTLPSLQAAVATVNASPHLRVWWASPAAVDLLTAHALDTDSVTTSRAVVALLATVLGGSVRATAVASSSRSVRLVLDALRRVLRDLTSGHATGDGAAGHARVLEALGAELAHLTAVMFAYTAEPRDAVRRLLALAAGPAPGSLGPQLVAAVATVAARASPPDYISLLPPSPAPVAPAGPVPGLVVGSTPFSLPVHTVGFTIAAWLQVSWLPDGQTVPILALVDGDEGSPAFSLSVSVADGAGASSGGPPAEPFAAESTGGVTGGGAGSPATSRGHAWFLRHSDVTAGTTTEDADSSASTLPSSPAGTSRSAADSPSSDESRSYRRTVGSSTAPRSSSAAAAAAAAAGAAAAATSPSLAFHLAVHPRGSPVERLIVDLPPTVVLSPGRWSFIAVTQIHGRLDVTLDGLPLSPQLSLAYPVAGPTAAQSVPAVRRKRGTSTSRKGARARGVDVSLRLELGGSALPVGGPSSPHDARLGVAPFVGQFGWAAVGVGVWSRQCLSALARAGPRSIPSFDSTKGGVDDRGISGDDGTSGGEGDGDEASGSTSTGGTGGGDDEGSGGAPLSSSTSVPTLAVVAALVPGPRAAATASPRAQARVMHHHTLSLMDTLSLDEVFLMVLPHLTSPARVPALHCLLSSLAQATKPALRAFVNAGSLDVVHLLLARQLATGAIPEPIARTLIVSFLAPRMFLPSSVVAALRDVGLQLSLTVPGGRGVRAAMDAAEGLLIGPARSAGSLLPWLLDASLHADANRKSAARLLRVALPALRSAAIHTMIQVIVVAALDGVEDGSSTDTADEEEETEADLARPGRIADRVAWLTAAAGGGSAGLPTAAADTRRSTPPASALAAADLLASLVGRARRSSSTLERIARANGLPAVLALLRSPVEEVRTGALQLAALLLSLGGAAVVSAFAGHSGYRLLGVELAAGGVARPACSALLSGAVGKVAAPAATTDATTRVHLLRALKTRGSAKAPPPTQVTAAEVDNAVTPVPYPGMLLSLLLALSSVRDASLYTLALLDVKRLLMAARSTLDACWELGVVDILLDQTLPTVVERWGDNAQVTAAARSLLRALVATELFSAGSLGRLLPLAARSERDAHAVASALVAYLGRPTEPDLGAASPDAFATFARGCYDTFAFVARGAPTSATLASIFDAINGLATSSSSRRRAAMKDARLFVLRDVLLQRILCPTSGAQHVTEGQQDFIASFDFGSVGHRREWRRDGAGLLSLLAAAVTPPSPLPSALSALRAAVAAGGNEARTELRHLLGGSEAVLAFLLEAPLAVGPLQRWRSSESGEQVAAAVRAASAGLQAQAQRALEAALPVSGASVDAAAAATRQVAAEADRWQRAAELSLAVDAAVASMRRSVAQRARQVAESQAARLARAETRLEVLDLTMGTGLASFRGGGAADGGAGSGSGTTEGGGSVDEPRRRVSPPLRLASPVASLPARMVPSLAMSTSHMDESIRVVYYKVHAPASLNTARVRCSECGTPNSVAESDACASCGTQLPELRQIADSSERSSTGQ